MTITEFLLARIAEDEAHAGLCSGIHHLADVEVGVDETTPLYGKTPFDGTRVLAECEAKRRIVDEHRTYGEWARQAFDGWTSIIGDDPWCVGCGYIEDEPRVTHVDQCVTLRALAAIYADSPDYREEWRA